MEKVLELTALTEDIKQFPEGIHKDAGKQGGAVSGGQRKRIGIARALYFDAEILFIDGLAESVDRGTEKLLASNIIKLTDKIIVVASESDLLQERAARIVKV